MNLTYSETPGVQTNPRDIPGYSPTTPPHYRLKTIPGWYYGIITLLASARKESL